MRLMCRAYQMSKCGAVSKAVLVPVATGDTMPAERIDVHEAGGDMRKPMSMGVSRFRIYRLWQGF